MLQHELVHNAFPRAVPDRYRLGRDELMECLVQLVARHSYPDLLGLLGGQASHAEAIMRGGYAYMDGTGNLVEIVRAVEMDIARVIVALGEADPREAVKRQFAVALGVSARKAGWLMNQAMVKPLADLRAKLAQMQAYARPQRTE